MGLLTISISRKDPFLFLRGGKPDNTVFPMTPEDIFDTYHTIKEDQEQEELQRQKQQKMSPLPIFIYFTARHQEPTR